MCTCTCMYMHMCTCVCMYMCAHMYVCSLFSPVLCSASSSGFGLSKLSAVCPLRETARLLQRSPSLCCSLETPDNVLSNHVAHFVCLSSFRNHFLALPDVQYLKTVFHILYLAFQLFQTGEYILCLLLCTC